MDAPPHLSSFSISVDSPCRDFCDKMLNDPSANNLRSLEDLSIKPSQLSLDDQERLATVLERAPNLRTLAALHLEEYYLGRDGSPLADAIAALSNLHALELRDVGEEGFELCRRLSCRPGTVRLKGQILIEMDDLQGTMVHFAVDRTALLGLPVFQRASTVVLDGFSFLPEDGPPSQSLEAGMEPWSDTRTLSLTNMDPLAVVAACPNLTHLSLGYFCPEDDHFEEFIHDREFPWSTDTLGDALGTRLQSLDVYVDTEQAIPPRAVSVTIRATRPIVLSVRFPAEAVALWEDLARMLQDAGSRTRYLDVVLLRGDQPRGHSLTIRGRPIGVPRTSPQQWLVRPSLSLSSALALSSFTDGLDDVYRRSACRSSLAAACSVSASASPDKRRSVRSRLRSMVNS